jgi:iron complex outermembrane recepter protein
MRQIILCLLVTLSPFSATSQKLITGTIFDSETNEPLAGANIRISGTTVGGVSDHKGDFSIPHSQEGGTLEITFVGYEKKFRPVSVNPIIVALTPSINNLQQLVVTANREASLRTESPLAISKLSASMINETKPTLLTELINKVPGVVMLNYNNEQHAMAIRQPMTTSPYFLYLEDGIPLRPMGIFNHNALIEMNIFNISSVEVVKGPASSLYGPEAVGGVINFITHRPTAITTIKVGSQGDQWGYRRFQYSGGGTIGKKVGLYLSGFEARQHHGWQAYSDYSKSSVNGRLDYFITGKTKLIAAFSGNNYYSDMSGSVDSIAYYNREYSSTSDFTYRKVHSHRGRLTVTHQWNEGNETTVTLACRSNYIEQNPNYSIRWITGSATASGERNRSSFNSKVAMLQHAAKFRFLNAKLLAGGSVDFSPTKYWSYKIDLDAQLRPDGKSVEKYRIIQELHDTYLSKYQADLRNYALYSQLDVNPHPRLALTFGIRYDKMAFEYINFLDATTGSKAFGQVTPKIGVTFDLLNDKGLYANYSQGFSPPGLTAIFRKRPNAPAGSEFYYNLEPARFDNFEIGGWAALLDNKVYIDATIYHMTGHKELMSIRQEDNSSDTQSAGKTLHRGVEYGLTYNPVQEWFFRFGGTNAIHRFEEFELSTRSGDELKNVNGNDMPQSPHWVANSEVTYKPRYIKGFRIALEWQRISSWYQDQVNQVKYDDEGFLGIKGVSYLNLRSGFECRGFEVFASISNLTNELYANAATRGNTSNDRTTFTPAAPRTTLLGIQYTFNGKKRSAP